MKKYIVRSWLTSEAKRIERKCLQNFGRSLAFTAIERILSDGAILEVTEKGLVLIDIEKYKENKEKYLKEINLKIK